MNKISDKQLADKMDKPHSIIQSLMDSMLDAIKTFMLYHYERNNLCVRYNFECEILIGGSVCNNIILDVASNTCYISDIYRFKVMDCSDLNYERLSKIFQQIENKLGYFDSSTGMIKPMV